jgi:hypothetical protein
LQSWWVPAVMIYGNLNLFWVSLWPLEVPYDLVVVRTGDTEGILLCLSLCDQPWASFLVLTSFSFLIYKMGCRYARLLWVLVFFVVLAFELRTSCSLGRCSITWATTPTHARLLRRINEAWHIWNAKHSASKIGVTKSYFAFLCEVKINVFKTTFSQKGLLKNFIIFTFTQLCIFVSVQKTTCFSKGRFGFKDVYQWETIFWAWSSESLQIIQIYSQSSENGSFWLEIRMQFLILPLKRPNWPNECPTKQIHVLSTGFQIGKEQKNSKNFRLKILCS